MGTQYTGGEFTRLCQNSGICWSMRREATCCDNAVAKSFFAADKRN